MAVRNHRLAALAFFVGMAVLHSWPLASDPAHLARLDNHDAELNTWIVAWVAHILPRDPMNLFEAPIFYPEQHTLAFSEHMFVPAVMGAPLIWAGASPVLVYNLLIMAGLALSGWAMYLLMVRWTGSISAGVIAGLLYAFNAHVLTRFVHLQAQHVEFFPLMLYALDRVIVDRRRKDALLLAAAFVLQALCSNYLLVFSAYALIVSVLVRWPEVLGDPKKGSPPQRDFRFSSGGDRFLRSPVPQLLLAGLISVVALAPFLLPYLEVDQAHGLARSVDVVTQYNAGWRDYFVTGGRLHYAWWSHNLFEGRAALFPGVTAMVLVALAFAWGRAIRDPRALMAIAILLLGAMLSLGTNLPGYPILHQYLPLLSGLRNVARWGWLVLAAVSILAGFGVAAAERRRLPAWRGIAVLIAVLVTIEAIRTPVGYTPAYEIPRIYDRLAAEPQVVLAEFPFYSGASVSENGPYVLANTRYFQPLLNGYSSFHPESFMMRGRVLNTFPSEQALAELRALHVTHVAVHARAFARRYDEAALKAVDTVSDLELVADDEGIRLYRLK